MTLTSVEGTLSAVGGTLAGLGGGELIESALAAWRASDYSGSGDLLDLTGNGFDLTVEDATFSVDHFVSTSFDPMLRRTTTKPSVGSGPFTVVTVWSEIDGDAGNLVDFLDNFGVSVGWQLVVSGNELSPVYVGATQNEFLFCEMDDFTGQHVYAARFGPSEVVAVTDAGPLPDSGPGLIDSLDGDAEIRIGETFGAGYFFYGAAVFDGLLDDAQIVQVGVELGFTN